MAGGMATMLLCTLLFSCNNEDFLESGNPEKACDNICLGISSDKNVQTRGYAGSDDEGYTADRFVLRSDDSADTLCVRAIVSDGINMSGFEGEQALTRGTPVGKDNFYDKFHVLAYWSKNGTSVDQFYMNNECFQHGCYMEHGTNILLAGSRPFVPILCLGTNGYTNRLSDRSLLSVKQRT